MKNRPTKGWARSRTLNHGDRNDVADGMKLGMWTDMFPLVAKTLA